MPSLLVLSGRTAPSHGNEFHTGVIIMDGKHSRLIDLPARPLRADLVLALSGRRELSDPSSPRYRKFGDSL